MKLRDRPQEQWHISVQTRSDHVEARDNVDMLAKSCTFPVHRGSYTQTGNSNNYTNSKRRKGMEANRRKHITRENYTKSTGRLKKTTKQNNQPTKQTKTKPKNPPVM